jgi:hypothetical protein
MSWYSAPASPNRPAPSWFAYTSNAASIASVWPAAAARQSRMARETRPANSVAMIRGRGSASGSTPLASGERADEGLVVVVDFDGALTGMRRMGQRHLGAAYARVKLAEQ